MSASFEFSEVDGVTLGTIGEPGQRTFYLQARRSTQLITLKLEKQQVGALAQLLVELLEDLPAIERVPGDAAPPLEEPALAEWAVGSMQLAYDSANDRVVLLAEEIEVVDEEGDPLPAGGIARLAITRLQAAALAERGGELVASGRPRCPLCGLPLDPEGHSCPKTNGHGPPTL
jgi:uncharacterized repeat protein (TIGR03847 family)